MSHPAEDPQKASWRCGAQSGAILLGDLEVAGEVCTLPAGHGGWHRSDSGNQWAGDAA